MSERLCKNCDVYKETKQFQGECRAKPPVVVTTSANNAPTTRFPVVEDHYFCGKFRPKGWIPGESVIDAGDKIGNMVGVPSDEYDDLIQNQLKAEEVSEILQGNDADDVMLNSVGNVFGFNLGKIPDEKSTKKSDENSTKNPDKNSSKNSDKKSTEKSDSKVNPKYTGDQKTSKKPPAPPKS